MMIVARALLLFCLSASCGWAASGLNIEDPQRLEEVERSGFSFGDTWVSASLALWIASVVLGGIGGRSARHARYLAQKLAAAGDAPSDDLRLALKSPAGQSLNYASFLATLAILALMAWKPGA